MKNFDGRQKRGDEGETGGGRDGKFYGVWWAREVKTGKEAKERRDPYHFGAACHVKKRSPLENIDRVSRSTNRRLSRQGLLQKQGKREKGGQVLREGLLTQIVARKVWA